MKKLFLACVVLVMGAGAAKAQSITPTEGKIAFYPGYNTYHFNLALKWEEYWGFEGFIETNQFHFRIPTKPGNDQIADRAFAGIRYDVPVNEPWDVGVTLGLLSDPALLTQGKIVAPALRASAEYQLNDKFGVGAHYVLTTKENELGIGLSYKLF